jgi:hypothetical protein
MMTGTNLCDSCESGDTYSTSTKEHVFLKMVKCEKYKKPPVERPRGGWERG